MRLAKILLFVMATTFIVFAVAYAVFPVAMVKDMGVRLPVPAARIDVAAVYGGLQFGIGVFLYYCLLDRRRFRVGFVATLSILGGLSGTRAVGMLLTGTTSPTMWSLLAVEAIGVPLSIVGLMLVRRSTRAEVIGDS